MYYFFINVECIVLCDRIVNPGACELLYILHTTSNGQGTY